ncbi:cytochrome c family protein [Aureliella helgolandensis]|uniref:Perchlorate reductase subunit gamma n=1 Tax=Aureliella helgolandensis TaxID=2527968 RepID=A0A518GEF5_9BACT|nr:cytochrome c family protein [Aureliella helgolandensis]QDV26982.1 Perchlorate reductase subunit gamma precursor [Aureliella helgolandensis]
MNKLLLLATTILVTLAPLPAVGQAVEDPRNSELHLNIDPHKVMGYESCEKCHASEVQIWKQTPHSATFKTLHRKPEAKAIASKLGIGSFREDAACIQCHYTMQDDAGELSAISGVSCESCHGAARDWISVHNDYGGAGATRDSETPEHRIQRLRSSISAGMRNPVNVYMVAQSCLRCHTVPNERLVNVGGHNAGSLDFELVSWSQGTVRHNFVRSDGTSNQPSDRNRLREMFVAGMIAELEFSLRATADATEKAAFGIGAAQRSARAAKRLAAAQSKLNQPLLEEALNTYAGVQLKLNNREQLTTAADQIAKVGVRFAATVRGSALEAIDQFIPTPDRWK